MVDDPRSRLASSTLTCDAFSKWKDDARSLASGAVLSALYHFPPTWMELHLGGHTSILCFFPPSLTTRRAAVHCLHSGPPLPLPWHRSSRTASYPY